MSGCACVCGPCVAGGWMSGCGFLSADTHGATRTWGIAAWYSPQRTTITMSPRCGTLHYLGNRAHVYPRATIIYGYKF